MEVVFYFGVVMLMGMVVGAWVRFVEHRVPGGVFTKGKQEPVVTDEEVDALGYTVTIKPYEPQSDHGGYRWAQYTITDGNGRVLKTENALSETYEDAYKEAEREAREWCEYRAETAKQQTKIINI